MYLVVSFVLNFGCKSKNGLVGTLSENSQPSCYFHFVHIESFYGRIVFLSESGLRDPPCQVVVVTLTVGGRVGINDDGDGSNWNGIVIIIHPESSIRLAASHALHAARWPILEACWRQQRATLDTTINAAQGYVIMHWHCIATNNANTAAAAAHDNGGNNLCCMMTDDTVALRGSR